jgi:hypothetical protein
MDAKTPDWLWYAKFANHVSELPIVKNCMGVLQNGYHQYDIFNHSQIAGSRCYSLSKSPLLAAAGLFHDIAKPSTATPYMIDGSGTEHNYFPRHAEFGKELVSKMSLDFFEKWGLDQDYIADITGTHSIPMNCIKNSRLRNHNNHQIKRSDYVSLEDKILDKLSGGKIPVEDALTLFLADTYAKGYPQKNNDLIRFAEYLYLRHVDNALKPIRMTSSKRI